METPNTRPNILLITTDQQRYDTLACNGSLVVRTPVLDGLAREGVRFEHAYVNNPVCIPSRACIQTGRYTHQHGVRYMESKVDTTPGLPFWEETFMERLQVAGYRTGAAGKIHMFPPRGFDYQKLTHGQGARWDVPYGSPLGPAQLGDEYAHWLEQQNPGAYARIYEQRRSDEYKRNLGAVTSAVAFEESVDYWAAENAIEFIRESGERPFFLWYGLCNPHTPVDAPGKYASLYDPGEIPLTEKYRNRPNPDEGPSERVVRRWIAHYYGLCTMVDDLVGRVIEELKKRNLIENTLVLFTSDHGEMMGDLGRFGKGNFLEEIIRVPLIVRPPAGDERVAEIDRLVELIDLAPTVLDYAGLPVPEAVQGESLRPLVQTGEGGKDAVLGEFTANDRSLHGKCLRTERYKYVHWTGGRPAELYDLREDPGEWSNLAGDPAFRELLAEMQGRLIEHLSLSERPILRR